MLHADGFDLLSHFIQLFTLWELKLGVVYGFENVTKFCRLNSVEKTPRMSESEMSDSGVFCSG